MQENFLRAYAFLEHYWKIVSKSERLREGGWSNIMIDDVEHVDLLGNEGLRMIPT